MALHLMLRPPGFDNHPLLIGAISDSGEPTDFFLGTAANVRMWGVARSQSQIQADLRGLPAANEPQSAGLIGRWNPEQAGSRTLADTSGQHHDGRLVGNVSVVPIDRASAPPGLPACRYALRFDGPDGHVEVPDAPGLRPRSFTIEGWFKFARDDRKCWLFSRRVGELFSVSLALGYDDPGTSEKLDVSLSHLYALLAANDLPGYRQRCRRLVEQYRNSSDPALARVVAHLCSRGPAAVDDYSACVELAERADAALGGHDSLSTLGAILYRAGRFSHAVRHLQQAVTVHGEGGSPRISSSWRWPTTRWATTRGAARS